MADRSGAGCHRIGPGQDQADLRRALLECGPVYLQRDDFYYRKNLPEKNGVEIAIEDTGVGIPPEALPHLFDPFHPVDGGGTEEAERAGFGLRVVKDLVDLLQGEIRVQSKAGKGSLFTVFLPYSWRG